MWEKLAEGQLEFHLTQLILDAIILKTKGKVSTEIGKKCILPAASHVKDLDLRYF